MNFQLRSWQLNDIDSLVKHANNFEIARFMTDGFPHPYTQDHGLKFIEMAMSKNPVHIFAIDVESEAIGGIGIHPQADIMRKNAELGYWLSQQYWGKGIMTKAIAQITEYAFNTFDINRIYARPFSNNIASQRVLEKSGFILEARIAQNIFKNNEFLDELIFAKRRTP